MPCKLAIPTMSLGHCTADHTLNEKLDVAQSYRYQGVETCYEDLIAVASQDDGDSACDTSLPDQVAAAVKFRTLCQDKGLQIVCLQPFPQYDGLLNRHEHESRSRDLLFWITLARALGTDMIMIPASLLPEDEASGNLELIANDFQRAAHTVQAERPHIRFAYESRCSATYINRWEYAWEVVEKVDRANFGMCLDTFHVASLDSADPAVTPGRLPDGVEAIRISMQRLVQRVKTHVNKIFLFQIGDARPPDEPIIPGSSDYDPKTRQRTIGSQLSTILSGRGTRHVSAN